MEQNHADTLAVLKHFIETGSVKEPNTVPTSILDSWKRSRDYGVDPYQKKAPVVIEGQTLRDRLKRNKELIEISRPFLETLYSFFKGSGFIASLNDAEGHQIDMIGDEDILRQVKKANFIIGSLWSEELVGTNITGMLIRDQKPIQLISSEHYCRMCHVVTGTGAPIHDPENGFIGGLAIFGVREKANPHTLGMVVAAAHALRNFLHTRRALKESELAHRLRNSIIESIPEALIAVNHKGLISLTNENAKRLLSFSSNIVGQHLRNVIGPKNDKLFDLIYSRNTLMDVEVQIVKNGKPTQYTLTCNSTLSTGKKPEGKIIILNEIIRSRTLVNRMTGARAKFHFRDIIGRHPRALETISLGKRIAKTSSTVLLLGESGTGKNIFAPAIHNESARAKGPFVSINCAAIPRELIASELFGYSDGAFTGSKRGGNPGKFELSDGGTLCLDEIGEMPLDLQAVLLSVIEDRSIIRIGGREVVPVDVRIIATTNKNLKEEIRKGHFREDLYYRLNVMTIEMVPLREMKSDIIVLANYFVDKLKGEADSKHIKIDDKVFDILTSYLWPGNVRELQNVIERALSIAVTDRITEDLLPPEIRSQPAVFDQDVSLERMERHLILGLMQSNLSKSDAAKKLNISRCTLYRKLKKYGISY